MRIFTFLLLCCFFQLQAQEPANLDFETSGTDLPTKWNGGGKGYVLSIDTEQLHNGAQSVLIANDPETEARRFGVFSQTLPFDVGNKKITLGGWIKTEEVAGGFVGLWLRQDQDKNMLGLDNMSSRRLNGTTDWQYYEISLDIDPVANKVIFGGLMSGTGKAWFDNFSVKVDGVNWTDAEPRIKPDLLEHSGIAKIKLSKDNLEHLEVLGLVWGFLKYYHPAVAASEYDWDQELFKILPKVLAVKNAEERDAVLSDWIDGLSRKRSEPNIMPIEKPEYYSRADLSWLERSSISSDLKARLSSLQERHTEPRQHAYIDFGPVGNPDFSSENKYSHLDYPDAGFRLLAVYRYWNMIQYFFPYRYMTDREWTSVFPRYISRAVQAKDALDYRLAMLEMIAEIKDTHANLWGNDSLINHYWGELSSPVSVRFLGDSLVVTGNIDPEKGPATGLLAGDIITHINKVAVKDWIRKHEHQFPASNVATRRRNMARKILKGNAAEATLKIIRGEEILDITFQRYPSDELDRTAYMKKLRPQPFHRWLKDDIGYITLATVESDNFPKIFKNFKDAKGIVIDIRNYPSEFVVFSLGKYLMPQATPFVKFTKPTLSQPGDLQWTSELYVGQDNPDYFKGKVIILLDESSQSQAEYTAMAFRRAPRATVLGSTTAGADGNVSRIYLPGGLMTMISGIGVYYPDGTETQRIGIVPDEWIVPSIEGIKAGKDELLDRAIEIIEE